MLTSEWILSRAKNPRLRVGIGAGPQDPDKVEKSAQRARERGYGTPIMFTDPMDMVESLRRGEIHAAVRGDLDSNVTMRAVRSVFSVDRILRVALLQPAGGSLFFFAPVGVDEGWTVDEKVELARLTAKLLRWMDAEPEIGILSGGRSSDVGRHEVVDRTITDAEEVVRILRKDGLRAQHSEILIENASARCNLIIAPDGISGNLIFRTLHFLGHGQALGAPILNIKEVFVDTSRAKSDYVDSIALASALAAGQRI
jgi:putative methanogen marker protein 4